MEIKLYDLGRKEVEADIILFLRKQRKGNHFGDIKPKETIVRILRGPAGVRGEGRRIADSLEADQHPWDRMELVDLNRSRLFLNGAARRRGEACMLVGRDEGRGQLSVVKVVGTGGGPALKAQDMMFFEHEGDYGVLCVERLWDAGVPPDQAQTSLSLHLLNEAQRVELKARPDFLKLETQVLAFPNQRPSAMSE